MFNKLKIIIAMCFTFFISVICVYASEDYSGYIVAFKEGFLPESNNQTPMLMSMSDNENSVTIIYEDENLYKIKDEETLDYYISIGAVKRYEPDYFAKLMYIPEDTYYNTTYQKYLQNINAQSAWNLGCYGNDVKIGIIDSGIYNHNDLKGAFVGGENFVSAELGENDENSVNYYDTLGHGTFVAGIIGAQYNGYMLAGIAPKAELYSLKCTTTGSNIQYSDIINCIYSAVNDYDCDVINMSLGGIYDSFDLYIACLYARSKGAILCAAAGNDALKGNPVMYPAAYGCVISVASVDNNNVHCSYSEYNNTIHVCAPGGNNVDGHWIAGLDLNNSVIGRCGTSFACPQVTAAAAIAKNINPDINHDEFAELLKTTSTDLGEEGYGIYYGYGLLNIDAICNELLKDKELFVSPVTKWHSTRSDMTVFNNSDLKREFFSLWKHDGNSSYEIISADAKSSKEIIFTKNYENLDWCLIDKPSLRPLAKNSQ